MSQLPAVTGPTGQVHSLLEALQPLIQKIGTLQAADPRAAEAALDAAFPLGGAAMQALKAQVRKGVDEKWLCDRENAGVRFSRVLKAPAADALSIDAVHMQGTGMGHTHVNGEFDLCFAVSGSPKFDGRPEGWVVYAPNTWHVPTVEGGVMDILYFLPGGGIRFGDRPEGSTAVGLQAER